MADNSYAQLIDDFENGINVLKGETLTEYIKRMGGVDYESKADGGRIGFDVGGSVLGKVANFFFDEEGNASQALQRAKFEISKFISDMGTDLETGAEWYNKLEPEEQREIIEEKMKYRERGELGGVPVYDEKYAGKFGIGGNYADGGAIGIEVLFGPKRENFRGGGIYQGRGGYGASRSRSSQGPAGGASAGGNYGGNVNTNQTYGGGSGGNNQPPVIVPKKKLPVPVSGSDVHPMYQNWIRPAAAVKTDFLKKHGWYSKPFFKSNPTTSAFLHTDTSLGGDEYDKLSTLTMEQVLNNMAGGKYDKFPTDVQENLKEQILGKVDFGDTFEKNWSTDVVEPTIKDGKIDIDETKLEVDEMPVKPKDVLEIKDGGRVGFQTGGWADNLEGEAKGIYDSMTAYGASDAEIQAKLQAQNLWNPDGTTNTEQVTGIINQDIGGGDNTYPGQIVDQTDYSFNKKNYAPGGKLEINPEAIGMSFFDSQPGSGTQTFAQSKGIDMNAFNQGDFNQKKEMVEKAGLDFNMDTLEKLNQPQDKGFIESFMGAAIPSKQFSQFTSPGTGDVLKGPAELGFMSQQIEGIPGNLTREDLRSMYDNYNKFTGRGSNYQMARVPGTAGNLINLIPYVGTVKKGAEAIFGPQGDTSLQGKYTVDNAGYGSTGGRDEFGLATFDKKDGFLGLKGDVTRDYVDRMEDRVDFLENDFFSGMFKDINNLTDAEITAMKNKNNFNFKQLQAYKNRIATEKINSDFAKKQAEIEAAKRAADIQATQSRIDRSETNINRAAAGNDSPSGASTVNPHSAYGKAQGYTGGNPNPHTATGWSGSSKKKAQGGLISYNRGGLASMFTRRR